MSTSNIHWFVGASYGKGSNDQTDRFVSEGIWENGFKDKHFDTVKSMQVGEKIAIKAAYTRKKGLPFDNKGRTVSVLGIKAIGTITRNHGDGRLLDVNWEERFEPIREWYFYSYRATIWRVIPDDWMSQGLVDFTFNKTPQDLDRFRNDPFWKERFGDIQTDKKRFLWTQFYEEFADKLLEHKEDRSRLMECIHQLPNKIASISVLLDQPTEGVKEPLADICPFTVLGLFNRGIKDSNRIAIATELAEFLGVEAEIPNSFEGIPVVNNQRSWFFAYQYRRASTDIDTLWSLFAEAIEYSNHSESESLETLLHAYDKATRCWGTGWNLSMGLYWIRPWRYLTLDGQSRLYIEKKLGIKIGNSGIANRVSATDYLKLMEELESRFKEDTYPIHSFPELSLAAWAFNDSELSAHPKATDFIDDEDDDDIVIDEPVTADKEVIPKFDDLMMPLLLAIKDGLPHSAKNVYAKIKADFGLEQYDTLVLESTGKPLFDNRAAWAKSYLKKAGLVFFPDRGEVQLTDEGLAFVNMPATELAQYTRFADFLGAKSSYEVRETPSGEPYTIASIIDDGCFLPEDTLKQMLSNLKRKKNIILQGPPGTGKTWLAKRLAYALTGYKKDSALKAVQFHPNLSYEDFIRGWRPSGEGKLELIDGPFMEMISRAKRDAQTKHVFVIEEINRGNPAQIFGEMLTLLEADKRTPDEALELSYRKHENEKVHIPANLYVIGTMNIADRSLALVDLALRRRFAFYDLEPTLGTAWQNWVSTKSKLDIAFLTLIEERLLALNDDIENDRNLGSQFKIGHSYVTPNERIDNANDWFKSVVDSEIRPLLEEYWFDDPAKAQKAVHALLDGIA